MKNQQSLIILREFDNVVEAHIARGVLESNGVECILNNEAISSIYPSLPNSLGSIQLLVREEDVEQAEAILSSPAIDQ